MTIVSVPGHELEVTPVTGGTLAFTCSCGAQYAPDGCYSVTLDSIAKLYADHVTGNADAQLQIPTPPPPPPDNLDLSGWDPAAAEAFRAAMGYPQ